MKYNVNKWYNAYNYNYCLCPLCCLEAQIPENVIDQMNQVLINQWNLLDKSSLCRVPET